MAEYLIQDTTLDAIADAINAKTGGSSAMTPAEMAAAIAAIPSGGGGSGYTLIYDDTLSEDVTTIRIDFTESMQEYNAIWFKADSPEGSPTYPYITANKTTGGSYWGQAPLGRAYIMPSPETENVGHIDNREYFTYPISFIYIRGYYSNQQFLTGTRIRMWGAKI